MTTSSKKLKQKLGPTKRWLKEVLDQSMASPYPLVRLEEAVEDNIQQLTTARTAAAMEKEKLHRRVNSLSQLNEAWLEYLTNISETNALEEENTYTSMTEGEEGFLELLFKGEQRLDELSVWIMEIETTIKDLKLQHAMTPETGSVNGTGLNYVAVEVPRAQNSIPPSRDAHVGVHLPQIALPKFDGDPLKYFDFWDAFESAVHCKTSISPVEKIIYLKSLLTGPAAKALSGISSTGVNYSVAITILRERFGKREIIIDKLYTRLSELPIAKSSKIGDLRPVVDELETLLRQLEVLGEDIKHNSLVRSILDRLPKATVLRLREQYKQAQGPWDMQSLRHALASLVETHEEVFGESHQATYHSKVVTSTAHETYKVRESNVGKQFNRQSGQSNVFVAQASTHTKSAKIICLFCDRSHYSDECRTYKTMEARKKRFAELKRCFICTRQGCLAKSCNARPRECQHCRQVKVHYRALCPQLFCQSSVNVALTQSEIQGAKSTISDTTETIIGPVVAEGVRANSNSESTNKMLTGSIETTESSKTFQNYSTAAEVRGTGEMNTVSALVQAIESQKLNTAVTDVVSATVEGKGAENSAPSKHLNTVLTDVVSEAVGVNRAENSMSSQNLETALAGIEPVAVGGIRTEKSKSPRNWLSGTERVLQVKPTILYKGSIVTQLMTKRVVVINPKNNKETQIRVFFDTGSHISFINNKIADLLKLETLMETEMSIKTFGNQNYEFNSNLVEIELCPIKKDTRINLRVQTAPKLMGPVHNYSLVRDDELFMKQKGIDTTDSAGISNVDMILGMDYFWDFVEIGKEKMPSGLYLLRTKLGEVISGSRTKYNAHPTSPVERMTCMVIKTKEESESEEFSSDDEQQIVFNDSKPKESATDLNLTQYWSLETIGILDDPTENDDEIASKYFESSLKWKNGRYMVTLPWKPNVSNLPDNLYLATSRLKKLLYRLRCQSGEPILPKIDDIIKEYLSNSIIEKVKQEKINAPGLIHYIPHLPVITPSRATTKIRVVFDASARAGNDKPSLNDCLYRGPILLPDLCGILLRFCMKPVAMMADIEKAFLQVGLQESDRNVTRFLWPKNIYNKNLKDNIETYRFCRVPFGIMSSPFLLGATLKYHLTLDGTKIAEIILDNLYVDNLVLSVSTSEEAISTYEKARELLQQASMNLREWSTNDQQLLDKIPKDLKGEKQIIKTLGICWNTVTDTFNVTISPKYNNEADNTVFTKRLVLHELASLYDPLGYFSPVTLLGKLFIKALWDEKLEWDEPLTDQNCVKWRKIRKNLIEVPKQQMDRYCGVNPSDFGAKNLLMVFVDASSQAFGAVVYLKTVSKNGKISISLKMSKTRITTKKTLTLPRAELMAILIGMRLAKFVKEQIKVPVKETYLFSDSKIALSWVMSTKPLSVFIANRVEEIQSHEEVTFFHVKSQCNPADCASRGVSTQTLMKNQLWWKGPPWLTKMVIEWPYDEVQVVSLTSKQPELNNIQQYYYEMELKKSKKSCTLMTVKAEQNTLVDVHRFSKWNRLINTVKIVLKFLHLTVWSKLSFETREKYTKLWNLLQHPTPDNLGKSARQILIREMQQTEMPEVYEHQECKWAKPDKKCPYYRLWPLMCENGIIRLESRYAQLEVPNETELKYGQQWMPILLAPKAHLTNLLVEYIHCENNHAGVQHTLATVRKLGYWIPKGRVTVKGILNKCMNCRKLQRRTYKLPPMAPLPSERLKKAPAFQSVGLDYFGPLTVKLGSEKIKVWVCLVTCLVTRAIDLELVQDMSSVSFLNAFRRFVSRRGKPDRVVSDNAPQFRVASQTLKKGFQDYIKEPLVHSYFAKNEINWQFIVAYSPWQGGVYERLVGITKNSMKKAIGMKQLKWDEINTLLCEVEAIVNSRPLTVITEEAEEKLLRPIDLIQYNNNIGTPTLGTGNQYDPDYVPPNTSSKDNLLKYWRDSQDMLNHYWRIWYEDYVLCLQERDQQFHKTPKIVAKSSPTLGEVVLIFMPESSRNDWRLAQVTELIQGKDDKVRAVMLRQSNGLITKRSVNHVAPLELNGHDESINKPDEPETQVPKTAHIREKVEKQNCHRPVTRSMTNKGKSRSSFNLSQGLINLALLVTLFIPLASGLPQICNETSISFDKLHSTDFNIFKFNSRSPEEASWTANKILDKLAVLTSDKQAVYKEIRKLQKTGKYRQKIKLMKKLGKQLNFMTIYLEQELQYRKAKDDNCAVIPFNLFRFLPMKNCTKEIPLIYGTSVVSNDRYYGYMNIITNIVSNTTSVISCEELGEKLPIMVSGIHFWYYWDTGEITEKERNKENKGKSGINQLPLPPLSIPGETYSINLTPQENAPKNAFNPIDIKAWMTAGGEFLTELQKTPEFQKYLSKIEDTFNNLTVDINDKVNSVDFSFGINNKITNAIMRVKQFLYKTWGWVKIIIISLIIINIGIAATCLCIPVAPTLCCEILINSIRTVRTFFMYCMHCSYIGERVDREGTDVNVEMAYNTEEVLGPGFEPMQIRNVGRHVHFANPLATTMVTEVDNGSVSPTDDIE